VTSKSPAGPWSDPLGKPLLSVALSHTLPQPTALRDPCVFEDDDGAYYIIAGVYEYYVARLGVDMVSLTHPLRLIAVLDPIGPNGANRTDDKPFMHKHNGTYYLSWGCFYSTGASPYGPFSYRGVVLDPAYIAPDFQMPRPPPPPSPSPPMCTGGTSSGGAVCGCQSDGGTLSLSCLTNEKVTSVVFASVGTPSGECGNYSDGSCRGNDTASVEYVQVGPLHLLAHGGCSWCFAAACLGVALVQVW
jgi:hypothetical protein